MTDLGLLILRIVTGASLLGLGARTLHTWTRQRPARRASPEERKPLLGASGQVIAGVLLALGLWPVGAAGVLAIAAVALVSVDLRRMLWRSQRIVLPALLGAAGVVLAVGGPGSYSVPGPTPWGAPLNDSVRRLSGPAFAAPPSPPPQGLWEAAEPGGPPPYVSGRAIVGVEPEKRPAARQAVERRGGRILSFYEPGSYFIVETPESAPEWVAQLRGEPGVSFAGLDQVYSIEAIPNDPQWPNLWGLQKIGLPKVWDVSRGSPTVVVGVLDTGVDYRHEDIGREQMWTNPGEIAGNGKDDDGNGWVDDVHGVDCVNNDGNPLDDHNHGTHVAGTIAAKTDNGIGVAGAAWTVKIMALKFLSASGSGTTTDAIQCLDYAISMGANLTNNSWGGGGFSRPLLDAIGRAASADQLFVAAAGNDGRNTDVLPSYPASYPVDNIVSVAATNSTDQLSSFSNFGTVTVDLAAPGVGIVSTVRGGYATYSGTSMAAPHVAGTAALTLAANPELSARGLRGRIIDSADAVSGLAGKVASGARLNAVRAVGTGKPPAAPTGLTLTDPGLGGTLDLDWDDNTEPDLGGYRIYRTADLPESESRSWAPIATVAGSGYRDIRLITGTKYHYRVAARNTVGLESEPSAEGTGAATVLHVPSFSPTSTVLESGRRLRDPVGNLAGDDARYFRVSSKKKGRRHAANWYGRVRVEPTPPEVLSVAYDGSFTRSVRQRLSVFNFETQAWEPISSMNVSTADRAFSWSAPSPDPYVSSDGEVRVRVSSTARRSFTTRADLVLATTQTSTTSEDDPSVAPEAIDRSERRLTRRHNQARKIKEIRGLRISERLSRKAKAHSRKMADRGKLYHSPCLICKLRGFDWSWAGENVGVGLSIDGLHQAFMNSPPHRGNILSRPFRRVGIGVVERRGFVWVTVIFYG